MNTSYTATGIAVALAVVVAVAFIFFGTNIMSWFNGHSLSLVSTTTPSSTSTMPMENQNQNQDQNASQPSAGTSNPLAGIPSNVTQLMSKDVEVGTGDVAQAGDTVTVSYVGMLTNGTVFDASANHSGSFSFQLGAGQVIKGWDEGVVGMKVGGTRELVIPASLGYGSQAVGPIPANSTLVFEVKLLNVQTASSTPAQ